MRLKNIALVFKYFFQLNIIVQFAIVYNYIMQVLHGLRCAGTAVKNGKAAVRKCRGTFFIYPMAMAVGTAVRQYSTSLLQGLQVYSLPFSGYSTGNATHMQCMILK